MLTIESMVRGYHVYKDDWSPSVGDEFELEIEEPNRHDRYAVVIKVSGDIVGHVPREFSKIVYYFIKNGGRATGGIYYSASFYLAIHTHLSTLSKMEVNDEIGTACQFNFTNE